MVYTSDNIILATGFQLQETRDIKSSSRIPAWIQARKDETHLLGVGVERGQRPGPGDQPLSIIAGLNPLPT